MILTAFLQALGAILYISLVSVFIWNAENIFGKADTPFAPVLMLTLFVVSALVVGLIILWRPIILFWEKKKHKEAIKLIAYTTGFLFIFLLVIGIIITLI